MDPVLEIDHPALAPSPDSFVLQPPRLDLVACGADLGTEHWKLGRGFRFRETGTATGVELGSALAAGVTAHRLACVATVIGEFGVAWDVGGGAGVDGAADIGGGEGEKVSGWELGLGGVEGGCGLGILLKLGCVIETQGRGGGACLSGLEG